MLISIKYDTQQGDRDVGKSLAFYLDPRQDHKVNFIHCYASTKKNIESAFR